MVLSYTTPDYTIFSHRLLLFFKPLPELTLTNKLISNKKYTGRVLLQKTVSVEGSQIENDGLMDRYPYTDSHEAIISDEMFQTVQRVKLSRAKNPENMVAMNLTF